MLDMTEDLRVLFDPRQAVRSALDALRARLERLGARRVWQGALWHWDLKPVPAGRRLRPVTNDALAASYLKKVRSRLKVLDVLLADEAWSDVVCEAQELVELALKAMLRWAGLEPPKLHDVGGHLLAQQGRFPARIAETVPRLAAISARLRKEREFAFYGDVDFIPTEQYRRADAEAARADAGFVAERLQALLDDAR